MCHDEGMGICPWGTLGQRRFQTADSFAERQKANPIRTGKPPTGEQKAMAAVLEAAAKRKGTAITSVALAYCMAKAAYVFPIVGGRKVEHLKLNMEALSVRLSKEDIREIETGYVFDPGFPHTFISGTMFNNEQPRGAYEPGDIWLTKSMGTFDWVETGRPILPAEV
jgi:aryl-alcohol dehydrogenase-like predicted oxidoreductase